MIKRLASAFKPAIAATILALAGIASPASAQLAASVLEPLGAAQPAPQRSEESLLTPVLPGRSAILSSTPRPATGTAPPSGVEAVRPAVTHASLWPKIWANQTGAALDEQQNCIAVAIYHEARGEPFDGQLAVAEVIMNRAASGRYPADWCSVVKQPWQFSFVRGGRFPGVDRDSAAWSYAEAITRIAVNQLADALPGDVLWYHADYVAPSWGRRLARVEKRGAHIFYRAS